MQQQQPGSLSQIGDQIRKRWPEITDDEIAQARGDADKLADAIQRKYGRDKMDIKRQLQSMLGGGPMGTTTR